MENNHEILPLFPIPLFITTIPSSLSSITSWLDEQPMNTNTDVLNQFGRRSKNSYILNQPPCKELKTSILSNVLKFSKTILGYSHEEYTISQSWISHKYPTESHIPHTHPNSLISGVFYYGKFSSDTPQVSFHAPYNEPSYPTLRPLQDDTVINQFNTPIFNLKVSSGTLILFSSHLKHSVPKNNTKDIRKSLAFNVVPIGGFGREEELTELKFN